MSNWFITGVSRGFGKILTEELLQQGHTVVGTTRSGRSDLRHANLHVVRLDVTDAAQVRQAFAEAVAKTSKIDVVVNNAGFGIVGAVEEVSVEEIGKVFATNVFGTLHVTQAALPHLRANKSGHIINFSSVGGFVGIAGYGAYNASKFAVEGMTEALALELKPLGIHVTIVEPGAFRTDFLAQDSLIRAAKVIEDYAATSGQTRAAVDPRHGKQPGDPVLGVKVIIDAVASPNPPLRLMLGADALERIRNKIKQVEADMAAWEKRATGTSFAA
jgi:NAD(P)-dependent dehydrogenase (short-subunit alcohol dehydrogenase family)